MNLSGAYTIAQGETLSVGRVHTPTLAMLVEREKEIREFVPVTYFEVVGTFGNRPYPALLAAHRTSTRLKEERHQFELQLPEDHQQVSLKQIKNATPISADGVFVGPLDANVYRSCSSMSSASRT